MREPAWPCSHLCGENQHDGAASLTARTKRSTQPGPWREPKKRCSHTLCGNHYHSAATHVERTKGSTCNQLLRVNQQVGVVASHSARTRRCCAALKPARTATRSAATFAARTMIIVQPRYCCEPKSLCSQGITCSNQSSCAAKLCVRTEPPAQPLTGCEPYCQRSHAFSENQNSSAAVTRARTKPPAQPY